MLGLLTAASHCAHAAFVFTLTQVGNNVVVTGSGTLNTTALTLVVASAEITARFDPAYGALTGGSTDFTSFSRYDGGGLAGPAACGTGNEIYASSGSGDVVGIQGGGPDLSVPQGYISGTALSDSDTYIGATFTSLGFTPGTYTYIWGTGANADSLTVVGVAPEPGTWALLGIGAASMSLVLRRARRRAL